MIERLEVLRGSRDVADRKLSGQAEPLRRIRRLDRALRLRNRKETPGDVASEWFRRATKSLRRRPV